MVGEVGAMDDEIENQEYWTTLANTSKEVCNSLYSEAVRLNQKVMQILTLFLTIMGIMISATFFYVNSLDSYGDIFSQTISESMGIMILIIAFMFFFFDAFIRISNAIPFGAIAFGPDPASLFKISKKNIIELQKNIFHSYNLSTEINKLQILVSKEEMERALLSYALFLFSLVIGVMIFFDTAESPILMTMGAGYMVLMGLITQYSIPKKFKPSQEEINKLRMKIIELSSNHPSSGKIKNIVKDIRPISLIENLRNFKNRNKESPSNLNEGTEIFVDTIIITSAIRNFRRLKD